MNPSRRLFLTNLLLLVFVCCCGDRYWAGVFLVADVVQLLMTPLAATTIGELAPCLLWLLAYRVTGNRELFFPFTMYLAASASLLTSSRYVVLGIVGGGAIMVAFTGVRTLQAAPKDILGVELAVACGIVTLVLTAYANSPRLPAVRIAIAVLASLLAYSSLAI